MININSLLNDGQKILSNSSIKTSMLDAEILLCCALKRSFKEVVVDRKINIKKNEINIYKDLIRRRKLGEPVAYIVKNKEFWKHSFYVDRNVLIPRPDSEIIIEEALKVIDRKDKGFILDIGTGSGCLVISLAKERPNFFYSAIDISKNAIKVAKINAKMHQLENRIKFYQSCVDNFFKGKYDLIISNPPYINKVKLKYLDKDIFGFEPLIALEGGLDGSSILNKVIKKSSSLLKVGGKLILEIGFDQKLKIMKFLKNEGFYVNKVVKDYGNNDRCLISTKI
tara:strand:- start:312 stop:1157 length:846 start_codon:yes stop_codon:yes gene_type:complete